MKVLRIYHSAVVTPWRQRDRELIGLGAGLTLVSSAAWNEGGRVVALQPDGDTFVVGARTLGHHPFLFVYDPWPIWRALRAGPIDVLDIHEEPASLAVAEVMALAWMARRRPAVCLYNAQNIEKRYPIPFRWLERFALRRVAAVHTCNEAGGRILRAKGFSGTVRNLGLGVDVGRFRPAPATGAGSVAPASPGPGPLRVGYVGRLEAHKGVAVLIDAAAATPGIVVDIVGDGPERERLGRQVTAGGLADRVTLQGFATHDQLPAVYQTFDVVVIPSLETPDWIEQFGRVAVEAMASGAVVVASDSGSLPEVLGEAGVLVPVGDVAALGAALAALRDDPERRRRLVAAGLAQSEQFSWPSIAARQLDLYEEMIS